MKDTINHIRRFLDAHQPELFELLEKMVNIQTHSLNKDGVDRLGDLIARTLEDTGLRVRPYLQEDYGNHIIARTPGAGGASPQMLMVGHMDTVFPPESDFQTYSEDASHCYGPGVIDMKGGLVAGIFALKALAAENLLQQMPLTFIFNSDEEIGSVSSRSLIRSEAAKSAFAVVLECGGINGEVVTGRKGNMSLQLDVSGIAGHAAFVVENKASAILALAHKTISIEALNDADRGISANVGKIAGGIGPNTVSDRATARIDLRYVRPADGNWLRQRIDEIVHAESVPGTVTTCSVITERAPMPANDANRRMFTVISDLASRLDVPVVEEFRYGVSDANLIAAEHTPVIDGLGPCGAHDHSEREYMIKTSLPDRTLLLAAFLADSWERHQSGKLFTGA